MNSCRALLPAIFALALTSTVAALDRPDVTFKVFQFPADKIPRIDGNTDDWAMVPESYVIGMDQFVNDSRNHPPPDPKNQLRPPLLPGVHAQW